MPQTKRPRGRPPLPPAERLELIVCRVGADVAAWVRRRADEDGITRSAFSHQILKAGMAREREGTA